MIRGLHARLRRASGSRSKPGAEAAGSGGPVAAAVQRGRSAVWEGKFLILSLA